MLVPGAVSAMMIKGAGMGAPTTWNPADKGADVVLSNGNLTYTGSAATGGVVRSIASAVSGKYYVEGVINFLNANYNTFGLANSSALIGDTKYVGQVTSTSAGYSTNADSSSGIGGTTTSEAVSTGDRVALAFDVDAKKIWMKNLTAGGPWNNNVGSDPAAGLLAGTWSFAGAVFFAGGPYALIATASTFNFGATAFTGVVPVGFNRGFG